MNNPVFKYTKVAIGHGHGGVPDSFLFSLLTVGKLEMATHPEVFAHNDHLGDKDIYNLIGNKFGPLDTLVKRVAAMLEVLRIIAGDESDWNPKEGADTTAGPETPDEEEAGEFQMSNNSRHLGADLDDYLNAHGIHTAQDFINGMKSDPAVDIGYVMRLLRDSTRWDGPVNRMWVTNQISTAAFNEWCQLLSAA